MPKEVSTEHAYKKLLATIKQQVQSAQVKAALAVNSSLIQLYWDMGKMIADNQALFEGRNNYVEQLAKDFKAEFPDIKGFSKRNIFYFRKFYLFYAGSSVQQPAALKEDYNEKARMQQFAALDFEPTVQQAVGLNSILGVPWGHHMLILDKGKSVEEALFYLQQTIEHNWSRAILSLQIEQDLFARQGKAISNFNKTLPESQALMATQILKDPYNFGFLTLEPKVQELDIEKQLTEHITKFLLELGKGFAFIGRQYPLQVGEKDYRLDLLFYHIRLRCFAGEQIKVGSSINPFVQLKNQKKRFVEVTNRSINKHIAKADIFNPFHLVRVICFQGEVDLVGKVPANEELNFFIFGKRNFVEGILDVIETHN